MSDESKSFEVKISTVATGDGAEKTAAGLEKDVAATKQLTAENRALAESQKAVKDNAFIGPLTETGHIHADPAQDPAYQERQAAALANADAFNKSITAEQEKAVILEQELMLATRKAQIEAAINGDTAGLAKLRAELSIRQLTLQQMQREGITQQEINALVEEETVLINQSTEAIAARMAVEAAEAETMTAAQSRGPLGARGMRGMVGGLGEEMGVGALGFQLMGLAFIVETIYHLFEHHGEEIKKNREAQEKFNQEIEKEAASLEKIKTLGEVDSRRADILEKINKLNEDRASAEGAEYDKLKGQVGAQEKLLGQLDQLTPNVINRVEAEQQTKDALEDQSRALDTINEKYETTRQLAAEILSTHEKIEEIQVGADIAATNRAERDGKISHAQAEQQRQAIKNAADKNKFDEDQAASASKIAGLQKETQDDQTQAAQKLQDAAAAKKKLEDAAKAQGENSEAIQKGKDAEARIYKNLGDHDYEMSEVHTRDIMDRAAGEQANAQKDAINKASEAARADYETKSKLAEDAAKLARETQEKDAKQIADEQQVEEDRAAIHRAEIESRSPEQNDAVTQAQKRDTEEQKQKQNQQRQQAKKDAPDVESGSHVAIEGMGVAEGNFADQKKVREAAKKLLNNPLDAQLARQLQDLLQVLAEHTSSLNKAQAAAREKAFRDAKKYADDRFKEIKAQIDNSRSTTS